MIQSIEEIRHAHFTLFDGVELREVEIGGDEIVQDAQLLLAEVIFGDHGLGLGWLAAFECAESQKRLVGVHTEVAERQNHIQIVKREGARNFPRTLLLNCQLDRKSVV